MTLSEFKSLKDGDLVRRGSRGIKMHVVRIFDPEHTLHSTRIVYLEQIRGINTVIDNILESRTNHHSNWKITA